MRERFAAEILADRPFIESELDVETAGECAFQSFDSVAREAFRCNLMIDARGIFQRAVTNCVADDVFNLLLIVSQAASARGTVRLIILK